MNQIQSLNVVNPSTGAVFATVDVDSKDAALQKLKIAYHRFRNGARIPLHERISLLEKLLAHVGAKQKEFVETMVLEGGKPYADSLIEFSRALQGIKLAVHTVSEHVGSSIPMGYQASSTGRIATTQVFPRGVVLAFSAFNHPLNLIVHQIIPAFASGCPCVVKPAPDTPLSCVKLVEAMHAVGIPTDYIDTVITSDNDVASAMVESEDIAFFSFIGSAKVGWTLRGKLKPGVRCALEHGGVAPCIVSHKADLDLAVKSITKGAFYHAGQVCVSTQRVFVHDTVIKKFSEQLKESASQLVVGDAMEKTTDVGPLIRSGELTRIHDWVSEAVAEGAKCILGGTAVDERFYPPTILVNPLSDSKVSQKEIFGPVVCLYSYADFNHVLAATDHQSFAFQAAIFSDDIHEILSAYERVEASALMVNDHTAFRDDVMPFAGLNESGLGVGGIPYTIEEMQYEKMLVLK